MINSYCIDKPQTVHKIVQQKWKKSLSNSLQAIVEIYDILCCVKKKILELKRLETAVNIRIISTETTSKLTNLFQEAQRRNCQSCV